MELDSVIDVRMYHDVALIRYRAQIEVQGQGYPRAPYRFTDAYRSVTASGGSCGRRALGSLEAGI